MTFYYALSDFVGEIQEKARTSYPMPMVPVYRSEDQLSGSLKMIAGYQPRILSLDTDYAADDIAQLIRDFPLYRYQLEVILDNALALVQRQQKTDLKPKLEKAFYDFGLPHYNPSYMPQAQSMPLAKLRHPKLGQMKASSLAQAFLIFRRELSVEESREFGFERMIYLKPDFFFNLYDGYEIGGRLLLRFDQVLKESKPLNRPKENFPVEAHINRGRQKAKAQTGLDMLDYIRLYIQADQRQAECCHAVYEIVTRLNELPDWLRNEVKRMMEDEAMKQEYAAHIMAVEAASAYIEYTPFLAQALKNNAAGRPSPSLLKFVDALQNNHKDYAEKANAFAIGAQQRHLEAEMLKGTSIAAA